MDALLEALTRAHPELIAPPELPPAPRYDGWISVASWHAAPRIDWNKAPRVTMALIVTAVCEFYMVRKIDLCSLRRTRDLTYPRFVAAYLGREMTGLSDTQIGVLLGNRDPSSIYYGRKEIERKIKTEDRLADEIEILKLKLGGQA